MSEHNIREPYTFDRVVRIIFSIAGIVAAIVLLNCLKGVLLPFLVACLIAYMLEPLVRWNQRWTRLKGRFIPVVLTLLEACLSAYSSPFSCHTSFPRPRQWPTW